MKKGKLLKIFTASIMALSIFSIPTFAETKADVNAGSSANVVVSQDKQAESTKAPEIKTQDTQGNETKNTQKTGTIENKESQKQNPGREVQVPDAKKDTMIYLLVIGSLLVGVLNFYKIQVIKKKINEDEVKDK